MFNRFTYVPVLKKIFNIYFAISMGLIVTTKIIIIRGFPGLNRQTRLIESGLYRLELQKLRVGVETEQGVITLYVVQYVA